MYTPQGAICGAERALATHVELATMQSRDARTFRTGRTGLTMDLPKMVRNWLPATGKRLLVAEGVDRIQARRPHRGQEPEGDSDRGAEEQPDHRPLHGYADVEVSEHGDQVSHAEAGQDADDSADIAEDDRLQEKLRHDSHRL